MIVGVDIEQRIDCALRKNNFFFGTIYGQKGKICKTIYNKKEFWQELIKLAVKEAKQKRNLFVYGHNHYFDFLQYADLDDSNIIYRTISPFIFEREFSEQEKIKYNINKKSKNRIYFLDTFALYRDSLSNMAKLIGTKKFDWDFTDVDKIREIEKDIDNKVVTPEVGKYITYNVQDARIVYDYILYLKQELLKIGFNPKRLMTITLLSRNYYFNNIKKLEEKDFFGKLPIKKDASGKEHLKSYIFRNRNKNECYMPTKTILERQVIAGRGGRFEAFKLGSFTDCAKVDLNSAYTEAMNNIAFPDLTSLSGLIYDPDVYFNSNKREYLQKIGISLVHLRKKEKSKIGYVPVRYNHKGQVHQIFPNVDNLDIIGTYTNQEIRFFISKGFEVKKVLYTCYYDRQIKNPLPVINKKLYKLRQKGEFWNYLAKSIMNYFTGSTKQNREYLERRIDSVLKLYEYRHKGFKTDGGFANKFIYIKGKDEIIYSKSFMGQLYSDITAYIRIKMSKTLELIGEDNLVYVPCDAVIFPASRFKELAELIDIGTDIGQFKVEYLSANGYIISKQQYYIDQEVKLSGITKKAVLENYDKIKNLETIKTSKMVSLFQNVEKAGDFVEEQRNFGESQIKAQALIDDVKTKNFFIDELDLKKNREVIVKYLEA